MGMPFDLSRYFWNAPRASTNSTFCGRPGAAVARETDEMSAAARAMRTVRVMFYWWIVSWGAQDTSNEITRTNGPPLLEYRSVTIGHEGQRRRAKLRGGTGGSASQTSG